MLGIGEVRWLSDLVPAEL
ncbi:MAG: hypothetical protein JCHSAcid_15910 [uncultured Acidilobus sp. JCHS]|nr:MAG: hypothetical protein JCHSAcid_15910 [uncultured Acidilobus sp. JCHS]